MIVSVCEPSIPIVENRTTADSLISRVGRQHNRDPQQIERLMEVCLGCRLMRSGICYQYDEPGCLRRRGKDPSHLEMLTNTLKVDGRYVANEGEPHLCPEWPGTITDHE